MDEGSLLKRYTTVLGHVGATLSRVDLDYIDRTQGKLIGTIKRLLADARLDIRDWEMADSRAEMQRHGHEAAKRLEQARSSILLASEHNLFSPIEIAEVSARFDQFIRELER